LDEKHALDRMDTILTNCISFHDFTGEQVIGDDGYHRCLGHVSPAYPQSFNFFVSDFFSSVHWYTRDKVTAYYRVMIYLKFSIKYFTSQFHVTRSP
jgi:hypothetical protein